MVGTHGKKEVVAAVIFFPNLDWPRKKKTASAVFSLFLFQKEEENLYGTGVVVVAVSGVLPLFPWMKYRSHDKLSAGYQK